MCDTLVALGNSTYDGSVIFGKNSDRPHDEVQLISYAPRTCHPKDTDLKCTYISIPQVTETAAVLLSQPWWMWGAEMGVNEYGVSIGNESVYTHEKLKRTGLLGMDLLRLGLERGKTAESSLEIITKLLENHGQGGGCAYDDPNWMYHNSFIIADPKEAFVLETADDWWIVEEVKNVRSISNGISIRGKGDLRKNGIIQYAIDNDYCRSEDDFDFAVNFSGTPIPDTPSSYTRWGKSTILLNENKGEISPNLMMKFLRDHQAGICMHGGFESTGSQVSHLRDGKNSIHWLTGTTLPCVSIYKPYIFPIEGQKYYNPAPYPLIDSDWFWCKAKASKPISRKEELRNFENGLISKINIILNKEKEVSEEELLTYIKTLNIEAWNKSHDLIN